MMQNRPVIDSHWHLYTWEDCRGQDFRIAIDRIQKSLGLTAINICAIPIYQGLGPAQNILAALYKLHNPTAYAYGGLVYPQKPLRIPMPDGMDPLSQYRELMEIGFDGVKILETKPTEQKAYQVVLDDPYFDPLFEACEKDKTHMILHVADPSAFWDIDRIPKRFLDRGWFYGDGTYMSYDRMYGQIDHILSRHPQLHATFAHFFFLSEHPEMLEELFSKYEHVGVDLTPGAEMYADFRKNYDFYRAFFTKHSDRIMLGTDSSMRDAAEVDADRIDAVIRFVTTDEEVHIIVESCRGLKLSDEAADNILYRNFRRAAGDRPKTVNPRALKAYVEKYCHLMEHDSLLGHILEEVRSF